MKRIDGESDAHLDVTGLAYEPIVGVEQAAAEAPVLVAAATETSAEGFAIGEPTGDGLGRPISVDDTIKIGDVGGDGFGGDIIRIDDTVIGTGWYDGGSYDGGSYDYSYSGQWTTAVGDINGDGLEDSLVATYAWDSAGTYSAATHIVFGGGEEGFQLTDGGRTVYGWAVSAVGDVNGDGCDDLLVNTYDYANGSSSSYVVFGAAGEFGTKLDLTQLDGSNGFKVATGGEGTYSLVSAAGDVNGDGFADLSVGVYDSASGTYADYVVYGAAGAMDVQLQLAAILGDYPLGSA